MRFFLLNKRINRLLKTVKQISQAQTEPHKSKTQEGKKNNDFSSLGGEKIKMRGPIELLTIQFPTRNTKCVLSIVLFFFEYFIFW